MLDGIGPEPRREAVCAADSGTWGVGLLKPFRPQIILKPQMLDMEV